MQVSLATLPAATSPTTRWSSPAPRWRRCRCSWSSSCSAGRSSAESWKVRSRDDRRQLSRPGDRAPRLRFPPGSSGARPPPPTRSRARPTRTAAARRSGTPSATRPGRVRRRRHRRRRLRPLPPLPRRRRADGRARPDGLPVLGRLAAGPADGRGPVNPRGLDFYDRLVDELLGSGIEPVAHALPLGPAAGAGGRRRLARRATPPTASPTTRRLVHDALRRPGARPGPPSTSRGARRSSATARACTRPGRQEPAAAVRAGAPPAARPRPGRAGAAHAPAAGSALSLNLYPVHAGRRRPRRTGRGPADRRAAQPALPRPAAARGYPADVLADLAPVTDLDFVAGRRPGDHRRAARRCSGSTTTAAHVVRAGTGGRAGRGRPARLLASPWPGSERRRVRRRRHRPVTAMGWEIDPAGLTGAAARVPATTPASPLYVTENGAAFDDVGDRGRAGPRRRAARRTSTRTCGACRDAIDGRGRPARLLRLVAAGQLRVGLGLRQALRPRPRRLRDPATRLPRTARSGTARRSTAGLRQTDDLRRHDGTAPTRLRSSR